MRMIFAFYALLIVITPVSKQESVGNYASEGGPLLHETKEKLPEKLLSVTWNNTSVA